MYDAAKLTKPVDVLPFPTPGVMSEKERHSTIVVPIEVRCTVSDSIRLLAALERAIINLDDAIFS